MSPAAAMLFLQRFAPLEDLGSGELMGFEPTSAPLDPRNGSDALFLVALIEDARAVRRASRLVRVGGRLQMWEGGDNVEFWNA